MTLSEMSGATFSDDQAYRSLLWRVWDQGMPLLNLIMLNPSDAGALKNDPTVARQIQRAKLFGCGGLLVTNAFDLVATDPKEMKKHPRPLSGANNAAIVSAATRTIESGGQIIAAWGPNAAHQNRHAAMLKLLEDFPLYALVITKDGFCGHPLYCGYSVAPQRYNP